MANTLYDPGRNAFLNGDIDYTNDTIVVYLIDIADYTFSPAHQYLSSVATAGRIASATLTGKSTSGGVADANDTVLANVTGDVAEALILVKSTGNEATSSLIGYIDSVASGFPLTPNGGDVTITWDSGVNRIFKL